jgi:FKBP-type peptidyl-prolyl cis-trans isomerase (trigger factor)
MITHHLKNSHGTYIKAVCDKTTASISYSTLFDTVRVCVHNASNRAFRIGAGKAFKDFDAAVAGYKSGAVKAIIEAARDAIAEKAK